MSLLAIDAGNTRVKWALHDGIAWGAHGVESTSCVRETGLRIGLMRVEHIVASNVAGAAVADQFVRAAQSIGAPLSIIVSQSHQCGVINAYREPHQLGTDRWAALIGARSLQREARATLVILAGTALTVDALDAKGKHLGGIIVPGASLMHAALARGTAQLDIEPGAANLFPAATTEAISRGVADALAGAVERFFRRVVAHTGQPFEAFGTGGALSTLLPDLPFPVAIHDNLIFDGLRAIMQNNAPVTESIP